MDIFTLAFTLLYFIGTVEMVMRSFKPIHELDGVSRTGALQTLNNVKNIITCSRHCIDCVTFVYHAGDRICYLYEWPLTKNTTGLTFPGGSVVYLAIHDVVVPGRFLAHYLAYKHEVWYFRLDEKISDWDLARYKCSQMGGEMPQLKGNDLYDVFNGLDDAYPDVLKTAVYDGYWIAMKENNGPWVNLDGSLAEPLDWHDGEPNSGPGACGIIDHDTFYFPNAIPTFQLDDVHCVEAGQWTPRYVCQFSDL